MVIRERWSVSSSCLMDKCWSLAVIAHTVFMFTSVICERGRPVGFALTGIAFRSFTNIACHFNTVNLAKHLSPYASFNSESVSIAILPPWTKYFVATCYLASMSMFSIKEKKKKKRHKFRNQTTSICYKMHATQHTLFVAGLNDAYVSPLSAGMPVKF